MTDAIGQNIVDGYLMPKAQAEYEKDLKKWEEDIALEKIRAFNQLQNPEYLESLGLPRKMPRKSLHIMKTAMAYDKVGPQKPEVSKYYKRYGY